MSRTRSKAFLVGGITLTLAVAMSGCATTEKLSDKHEIGNALSGFDNATSAAFTVSLDSTPADLTALAAAEDRPMSTEAQKAIASNLDSHMDVSIQAPGGQTLEDYAKSSFGVPSGGLESLTELAKNQGNLAFSVDLASGSVLDLRAVGGVLYARADVRHLLETAGVDPSLLDGAIAGIPAAQAPVADAAEGKWVSIDLLKAAQSVPAAPGPSTTPRPAAVPRLIADLEAVYAKTVTVSELGRSDDQSTGYRLGAPVQQVGPAISGDLSALVGPDAATRIDQEISRIPGKNLFLELWVKDDQLTKVSLDLTQFLEKPVPGAKAALTIAVKVGGGAVTAPAGATAIDVGSLLSEVPAVFGGTPSNSSVLRNWATQNCLTGTHGTQVATRPCDGSDEQVWNQVTSTSDRTFIHLVNGRTGRCLDTDGAEAGHVYARPCQDSSSQNWQGPEPGTDPEEFDAYPNQASGLELDTDEAGDVFVRAHHLGESQLWSVRAE